jgi:curved DNA-binding protein CbpA
VIGSRAEKRQERQHWVYRFTGIIAILLITGPGFARAWGADKIDPYKSLGVSRNATDDEIKSAFRRLAFQHHPDHLQQKSLDIQAAGEEKFKEISEAYNILSDPQKRSQYDRFSGKADQQPAQGVPRDPPPREDPRYSAQGMTMRLREVLGLLRQGARAGHPEPPDFMMALFLVHEQFFGREDRAGSSANWRAASRQFIEENFESYLLEKPNLEGLERYFKTVIELGGKFRVEVITHALDHFSERIREGKLPQEEFVQTFQYIIGRSGIHDSEVCTKALQQVLKTAEKVYYPHQPGYLLTRKILAEEMPSDEWFLKAVGRRNGPLKKSRDPDSIAERDVSERFARMYQLAEVLAHSDDPNIASLLKSVHKSAARFEDLIREANYDIQMGPRASALKNMLFRLKSHSLSALDEINTRTGKKPGFLGPTVSDTEGSYCFRDTLRRFLSKN